MRELYERRLRHRLSAWLKTVEEKIREVESCVKTWKSVFVNQNKDQSLDKRVIVMRKRDLMSVS